MSNRRDFLKATGTSGLLAIGSSLPGSWLQAAVMPSSYRSSEELNDRVLVVIQLTGGNDGLNTVIPFADDLYYRNRLTLAQNANAVHRVNERIGLHPAMGTMAEMAKDGNVTIVQGVGYPQPNRSHFESMDLWHTAHRTTSQIPTGWLGRAIDRDAFAVDVPAVHLGTEDQPLALAAAGRDVPTIQSIDSFRLASRTDEMLTAAIRAEVAAPREADHSLLRHIQASAMTGAMTSERVESALGEYRSPINYPDSDLSRKLRNVAQLIHAGLGTKVFYVTLDGFDTHSNQAEAHASLLGQFSSAVGAFVNDLEHHGHASRVLTFAFSEFGRRVKENASRGTDHGAAAPVFLAGKSLVSTVFGDHPSLEDLDDGDLKYAIDYRRVYATLLEDWLGADSRAILGEKFDTLPILAKQ